MVLDQIHLHFYTTYSYNKWKNALQPCPLCNKIPEDIFHIIIDCRFTKTVWKRIERKMLKIISIPVTDSEKAFGLQPRKENESNATILRNWVTFSLRHSILLEEREAYYINNYHKRSIEKFFMKFNSKAQEELQYKKLLYDHRDLAAKFEKIVTVNNVIARVVEGDFGWLDIM